LLTYSGLESYGSSLSEVATIVSNNHWKRKRQWRGKTKEKLEEVNVETDSETEYNFVCVRVERNKEILERKEQRKSVRVGEN